MEWANLFLLLQHSTNSMNPNEIKAICSTSSILLCFFNSGGLTVLCQPSIPFSSNYPGSLDLAACSTCGSKKDLTTCVWLFISLLCLLTLPSLLLLLNPVSLTYWSKTPCEVQAFHPGIFLTPCPPCWSAGMWTRINSNLETLKVERSEWLSW